MAEYPKEIYYVSDQVTESISSTGIGEVWLYFYKENLIGVRDVRNKRSTFMIVGTHKESKGPLPPTINNLTEAHIKEAIDEHDQSAETVDRVPYMDLFAAATKLLLPELNLMINREMMGS